jgi:hypothetical protein
MGDQLDTPAALSFWKHLLVSIAYKRLFKRSRRYSEKKHIFSVQGIEHRFVGRPALSLVAYPGSTSPKLLGVRLQFADSYTQF